MDFFFAEDVEDAMLECCLEIMEIGRDSSEGGRSGGGGRSGYCRRFFGGGDDAIIRDMIIIAC